MNYTKNIILHVSLLTETKRVSEKKFIECEARFAKEINKYNGTSAARGWAGEILRVEFSEKNITTEKVVELIKKCYKTDEAIET